MSRTASLLPIVERDQGFNVPGIANDVSAATRVPSRAANGLIHDDNMPEVFATEEPGVMRDKEDNHYVPVLEDRNGHWFWKRLGLDEAHEIYTRSWTREDRQAEYFDGAGVDQ